MNPSKYLRNPVWLAAVSGLVFLVLLGVRLDVFRKAPDLVSAGQPNPVGSETWMNIYQNDSKIGYTHRRMDRNETGFAMTDTTFMRINTMGMVQDLHVRTLAALQPDLTLAGFDFTLRSNLFDFNATGEVVDGTLVVKTGGQETRIPATEGFFLAGGVLDAAWGANLATGDTRTFSVFDPATLGRRPVRVTAMGPETIDVMGRPQRTYRLAVDFMGATQSAWIGEDGSVVQESGPMGITLKRVTQKAAFEGLTLSPTQDLTLAVSVPANVPIDQPEALSKLRLAISGIDSPLRLDGDRQSFVDGILAVSLEPVPDPPEIPAGDAPEFLDPTPFIESDHPDIQQLVAGIVGPDDPPLVRVRKIAGWIYENIEKRPVLSVPSAWQTLNSRMGDCNEHAVLMAAMTRAAGIPAQVEAGLVYLKGRFYYHAWNAVWLGRWVTVDALMNQIPADVTHIRFVRGEPGQQIDLMGVIGAVRLKILDPS